MFERNNGAHNSDVQPLDMGIFAGTVAAVTKWLAGSPKTDELIEHLPALELAFAGYIKNHDSELIDLAAEALDRVRTQADLDGLDNATLAGLIRLDLSAAELGTRTTRVAGPLCEIGSARWDTELEYFRADATPIALEIDPHIAYIGANAKLGEAFYLAWRALDEQHLRQIAGDVLGLVSGAFDTEAGLYQCVEKPDGARRETQNLGTYAAAMQMFMTAAETTARRTYMPRAIILADFAAAHLEIERQPTDARIEFARALLRLEQFSGEEGYGRTAQKILSKATEGQSSGIELANAALAIEEAIHFPLHVVLIGDVETDEDARRLWFAAMKEYAAARALEVLQPTLNATRIQELGYDATDSSVRAYICIGVVCLPPVRTVQAFREAMRRAREI